VSVAEPQDPHASQQVLAPRLVLESWPDGLSIALAKRAEALANDEWHSLTEAVLHAHLLIEQALVERVRRKLAHPEVLDDRRFARLSFAQMITVYAGLHDTEPKDVQRLHAFNRLRNQVAHTLSDPETLIVESLQTLVSGAHSSPREILGSTFFYLFFGELLGVRGAHWHDPNAQLPRNEPFRNAKGQQVCHICGTR